MTISSVDLRTEAASGTVVVGPRRALAVSAVRVQGTLHCDVDRAEVKLRYRGGAVSAAVETTEDGFTLRLEEPAEAVAPGQVAVLYDRGAVVGAGTILEAR